MITALTILGGIAWLVSAIVVAHAVAVAVDDPLDDSPELLSDLHPIRGDSDA